MNDRPKYSTLQAWMEAHSINATQLAKMAGIGKSHMSHILTGGRRCSREVADRLESITNVDARTIGRWTKHTATDAPASKLPGADTFEQAS